MKEVKILHLFPQLLSLYGEYGNVAILKKALEDNGHAVTVEQYENGDLSLEGYNFVYIGSGTEANLLEASKRLQPYAEAIKQSVVNNQLWLVTGNAMALFGSSIDTAEGLNVFSYETMIAPKRYMGDALTEEGFVGFINTSCVYQGIDSPWLKLKLNPSLGNDKKSSGEGIHQFSFYATQLIGPLMTKNPHFLRTIYEKLVDEPLNQNPESNICKAYDISLKELHKRLESK